MTATVQIGPWTQGANEINEIMPGMMTFQFSPGCSGSSVQLSFSVPGWGEGFPNDAGNGVLRSVYYPWAVPDNATVPIDIHRSAGENSNYPIVVFEPGVDTTRSIEVSITPEGICPEGATLTAMSFDVVAIR